MNEYTYADDVIDGLEGLALAGRFVVVLLLTVVIDDDDGGAGDGPVGGVIFMIPLRSLALVF